MDVISCICFAICVIAGSFIGHMLYDISKAHKTHKGNEKRKIAQNIKRQVKKQMPSIRNGHESNT